MNPLCELGVAATAAAIRAGEVTSEAVTQALLERADQMTDLNALTTCNVLKVLEGARKADVARTSGKELGQLHGVPIVFKDNINVVGAPVTAGTPALKNHFPRKNAVVAQALFDAGALNLGKAGMHELAFGMTSNNATFGAVRNPYNTAMVAGGSSGGSAAAVAARICSSSIGTDTGGSVRAPAAFCGVSGFRPTVGRWSQHGIVPISSTRDTAGPIARSVADLALLDSVVTQFPFPLEPRPLKGLRIGVPRTYFWEDLDPEVERLCNRALDALRSEGAEVINADLPGVRALEAAVSFPVALFEVKRDLDRYLAQEELSIKFEDVAKLVASPDVQAITASLLDPKTAMPEDVYWEAINIHRPILVGAYESYFAGFDLMVFPTCPLVACPIGDDETTMLNGKMVPTFATIGRNTGPSSNAAFPGISIPIGLSGSGLPVGLEFDAAAKQDRELLAIALSVEKLFPTLPMPSPQF